MAHPIQENLLVTVVPLRNGKVMDWIFDLLIFRYALNLCAMKKVSIMEAQHNLSKVLQQVEEGHAVYVTRRKRVVAKVVPPEKEGAVAFPDFARRARQTWGKAWTGASTDQLLDESRGER
jgi:prevent-host-death family protein